MEQKKRHNPEITEQDLAVKAFDRNNDARPRSDNPVTLDQAVKDAEKETKLQTVEKGEEAFRDELNHLIWAVFGDVRAKYFDGEFYWHPRIDKPGRRISPDSKWDLYKIPEGWFKTYQKHVSIEPASIDLDAVFGAKMFGDGQFFPIKVTAYTPEALKQARVFAAAYEKFTGKPVTLVRECRDEEEMKEKLEDFVEQTSEEKAEESVKEQINQEELFEGLNIKKDEKFSRKERIRNDKKELKKWLGTLSSEKYGVRRTINHLNLEPDFRGRTFKMYEKKSFFGIPIPVTAAKIKRIGWWSFDQYKNDLEIKVYDPETLPVIAKFARQYQDKTKCKVEVVTTF